MVFEKMVLLSLLVLLLIGGSMILIFKDYFLGWYSQNTMISETYTEVSVAIQKLALTDTGCQMYFVRCTKDVSILEMSLAAYYGTLCADHECDPGILHLEFSVVLVLVIGSLYAIVAGPTTLAVPQPAMDASTFHLKFFFLGGVILALPQLLKKKAQ